MNEQVGIVISDYDTVSENPDLSLRRLQDPRRSMPPKPRGRWPPKWIDCFSLWPALDSRSHDLGDDTSSSPPSPPARTGGERPRIEARRGHSPSWPRGHPACSSSRRNRAPLPP